MNTINQKDCSMTPIAVIEKLLVVNRPVAIIILTGLAVFAAVAIFQTFRINDLQGSILVAGYIVGLGVALTAVSNALYNPPIQAVISWFITLLFILYASAIFVGAVFPFIPLVNPPSCLLRFWEDCRGRGGVIDRVAEGVPAPALTPVPKIPATSLAAPPALRVFVQFAGLLRREDVISVSRGLRDAGWNVQGADQGGERIAAAAGLNEVRYSSLANEDAARVLAQQIQATNLLKHPVTVRRNPDIRPDTLEVWISRT